jgi:hypothetical protein
MFPQRVLIRLAVRFSREKDGNRTLLEQFRSPDHELLEIALSTFREFPGSKVDEALAAEMGARGPGCACDPGNG